MSTPILIRRPLDSQFHRRCCCCHVSHVAAISIAASSGGENIAALQILTTANGGDVGGENGVALFGRTEYSSLSTSLPRHDACHRDRNRRRLDARLATAVATVSARPRLSVRQDRTPTTPPPGCQYPSFLPPPPRVRRSNAAGSRAWRSSVFTRTIA